MVVKIMEPASTSAYSLDYNDSKCAKGEATLIDSVNVDDSLGLAGTLERYERGSIRATNLGFHMSVNPGPGEYLDQSEALAFIHDMMKKLGKQPEFVGGMEKLMEYLQDNINYPRISQENGSQGRSFIRFVVNSDGSIQDVEVVTSSGDIYLDKEAVRVVEAMPKWKPGRQSGKPVRVYFTLPVNFRLQ